MTVAVPEALEVHFNAVIDERADVDRPSLWARLRDEAPVFFSERLAAFVVTRYSDVRSVLSDEESFWNFGSDEVGAPVFGDAFTTWRGREHNKKTGIVARRIRSRRAIDHDVDPMVDRITREQVDMIRRDTPIDLRGDYAMWIPLRVIAELTGIEQAPQLTRWYQEIMAGGVRSIAYPEHREPAERAVAELRRYLIPIIADRRRNPVNDIVSDLVQAEYDGEPLPDEQILAMVMNLLAAGVETTERALANSFRLLALDPELWDGMRAHRDDTVVVKAFCAEILRCFSPVQIINRKTARDVTLADVLVPRGAKVTLVVGAANRDPTMFENPDTFNRDRFLDYPERQFGGSGEIMPFGAGKHHCVGSRVALTEMVHGLRRIFDAAERITPVGELPPAAGFVFYSPPSVPVILSGAASWRPA